MASSFGTVASDAHAPGVARRAIRLAVVESSGRCFASGDGKRRQAGTGTLPQLHEDFTQLEALGVRHVTLDWYTDDLDLTRRHEWGWRMFATMAEPVFDLSRETVR